MSVCDVPALQKLSFTIVHAPSPNSSAFSFHFSRRELYMPSCVQRATSFSIRSETALQELTRNFHNQANMIHNQAETALQELTEEGFGVRGLHRSQPIFGLVLLTLNRW